jgi:Tfp pilus assembly protein PilV
MNERPRVLILPREAGGAILVEVLVSVTVFAIGLLALVTGSLLGARALRDSRDMAVVAAAAQTKLDSLASLGWNAIGGAGGSETVKGHAVSWSVTGDNPRTIQVIVTRRTVPDLVRDTLLTRLAK